MDNATPTDIEPSVVHGWIEADEALLIDVREPFEHSERHIAGAVLRPLPDLDIGTLRASAGGKRVVFHCKAGGRSAKAAARFGDGGETTYNLAGGIDAWMAAGLPTIGSTKRVRLPIMRQVQITAGLLVAAGVGLGNFASPWFLVLPGLIGCGLVFAGVSGWCGMAKLLAAMPWNQTRHGASGADSSPEISCSG